MKDTSKNRSPGHYHANFSGTAGTATPKYKGSSGVVNNQSQGV
ncbi:hypothetical protein [Gloeomargarita lithophora]